MAAEGKLPLRVGLLSLAVLAVAWIVFMAPDWSSNPDLAHGWLTPVLALYLAYEARRRGPARFVADRAATLAILGMILASGLLALTLAGLIAAALAWSHALTAFLLGVALSLLMLAADLACARTSVRWMPLNWAAVVSALLWGLSAPIPPGTYTRLTVSLQMSVTQRVLSTLHFLGVPAQQHGNLIELAHAQVGVEQACSGIRSLVSCVVAALFFSATLLRRPWSRCLLLVIAAPLAIAMNFLRSLALTLAADHGISLEGEVHDISGFAVLGVTVALLAGVATLLARSERLLGTAPAHPATRGDRSPGADRPEGPAGAPSRFSARLFGGAMLLAVGIVGFFALRTQPSPVRSGAVPALAAVLPATAPGWEVDTTDDLYPFRPTLRTSHLAQRTYRKTDDQGLLQLTVYLAYWQPGQAPVSLVSSHTPDACWPGSGWTAIPESSAQVELASQRPLPPAEYRQFSSGGFPQHVWFWHLYDGELVGRVDPFSPRRMIGLVLRYGIRSEGDQVFIRISSNRPWSALADQPLVQEVILRLQPLGLAQK